MRGEFFKASAARFFTVAATFAAGLANLKLYGRFFTPDVYGVVVVAIQLIGYLPMLDGGFRMATNRRLLAAETDEKSSLILFSQEIYSWLLVMGLIVGAVLMSGYAFTPHAHGNSDYWTLPLFLAMGGCGALSMFAGAQASMLLGLGAQASMSIINGLSILVGVGALAISLFAGQGLWAFPISMLASALSTYTLALFFLRVQKLKIPLFHFTFDGKFRQLLGEIGQDAWPAFRSQLSIVLVFSSDLIVASFFCKPAEVAVYGVLSRVVSIARAFMQVFNETAWPFIAARAQGFERFQDRMVLANAWLYGLAGGGLVVVVPDFIAWYMGPQWQPPAVLGWLLVLRFVVIGAGNPASYYLLGKGDFRSVARCTEWEVILSLAFSLLLGPSFGVAGIAVAYLLGNAGGNLFPFWLIYARARGQKVAPLLATTWLRVAFGFGGGWVAGRLLLGALFNVPASPFR